ncbi:MAG: branched-chain-amino-acid transaminase, partial [Fibrobacter sp.]|nr:branched-chain-amino-acid transaminase [Fibrobacter sp.]
FEGIRIYNGKAFKLQEHLKRLFDSAIAIALDIGMPSAELDLAIQETIKVNKKIDGYIRLIVTRGDGSLGMDPSSCKKARVIIIVGDIQLYPKEYYTNGIEIITSSYRRIPAECFDVQIKSLNYLNNVLAKIEAKKAGCLESVLLNTAGHVAECTGDNIFVVKQNRLLTPPAYEGALEGITRGVVLQLAKSLQIDSEEHILTRYDLYTADECFLTGTAAEVIPVTAIDGRKIGTSKPGPLTVKIIDSFTIAVRNG